ncbi:MAG: hypothetical protein B6D64_07150 [Bacteroidetes bacterium 4484_276]|nr:MAG: hypothetical protein B6D64_07150 [Bacteroidetes bacterium 4484_276]
MKKLFLLFFMITTLFTRAQNTMEKQYGDTVDCSGINVIQTYDNGFLITASKNPVSQYEDDLFIIRTNQIGDTLWTKTMPLESGIIAKGIQTFDSGYVFTGKTDIYLFLLKINSSGEQLWTKRYNFGSTYSRGWSIFESSDHNLFVVGENFIGSDVCCTPLVIRTDTSGNLLNTINLPFADYGRAYDIVETPDGNFVISYSSIYMSPPVPKLAKVNKNGSIIWHHSYDSYCECNVNLTHDNGFIISGLQINTDKPYLIKTDSAGNVIWNKSYSDYNVFNYNLKVAQSNDDGYLMTGGFNDSISDLILLKVNSLGDSIWGRAYGGSGDDFGNSIIATNDNGFAVVGYTTSFGSAFKEIYFLKTDSLGLITSINKYRIVKKPIKIFPNPFSSSTTLQTSTKFENLTLTILNSFGQEVKQFKNIHGNSFTFNRENLPGGIYFLHLFQKNELNAIEKVVIIDP